MALIKKTAFLAVLGSMLSSPVAGACVLGGDGGDPQIQVKRLARAANQEPARGGDGTDPRDPGKGGDGTDPRRR